MPAKVSFRTGKQKYEVESLMEDGVCVIRFGDAWYRTTDDFFQKAKIKGRLLTSIYDDLYGFKEVMA